MRTDTRALFSAYVSQIALINSVPDATVKFAVDPVVEQRLEETLAETSEFLQAINVIPVTQQKGEALGLGTTRTLAGRTDTAGGTARNPTNPTDSSKNYTYTCEKTDFDWSLPYALLDAWRHRPDFEIILRNSILRQQARDRIMIGWNGTSVAKPTNRANNPKLQDVNIGWLAKLRTNAPEQVFNDGALTVNDEGGNLPNLKAIYVKPGVTLYDESLNNKVTAGADYSSLDALVLDAKRLLPEWYRGDTDLVVIVGHDLVDDKYFTIAQTAGGTATEVEATDRILRSEKQIGGLPAVRVPFFPANAILITTLKNLSLYWQEETRRRHIEDEPRHDRIANYESVNEAYVIEDYELCALVENIVIGAAPARPDAP